MADLLVTTLMADGGLEAALEASLCGMYKGAVHEYIKQDLVSVWL